MKFGKNLERYFSPKEFKKDVKLSLEEVIINEELIKKYITSEVTDIEKEAVEAEFISKYNSLPKYSEEEGYTEVESLDPALCEDILSEFMEGNISAGQIPEALEKIDIKIGKMNDTIEKNRGSNGFTQLSAQINQHKLAYEVARDFINGTAEKEDVIDVYISAAIDWHAINVNF